MSSITALKYYRTLKESKIPEEEAYAQACAFDAALVDLATKDDLKELATKAEIKELAINIESKIKELATNIESKTKELATKNDLQVAVHDLRVMEAQINARIDTIRTLGWGAFAVIVMMLGVIMKMGGVFR